MLLLVVGAGLSEIEYCSDILFCITNNTINGDVNVNGTLFADGVYGGMWYHNHTAASLTLIDGVYQQLFMTNATHMHGFSGGYGYEVPSNLTAEYNGSYNINYYSVGSGVNNHVYRLTVFINEIIKYNCETHYKMAAGGDEITMSGNCLLDIVAGENISLRIMDNTGDSTGSYFGSNLVVTRVGK